MRISRHGKEIISTKPRPKSTYGFFRLVYCFGVLASEGWWEAWQPSPKVIRSYQWSETKLEDLQVSWG